ncbi:anti-sigma factor C-terminal domain-containing protein [Planococcus sp. CAU13]|uniref:anti-sigma factor C-terminal domain-containing protein n=1 Tax=Planococcus sp. CAU13 TaxID=1541197 RepID=UPI001377641F|nr:anti-sigma factor C-terminal domain-containing protein [Planococcus sp. CAU13]
MEKKILKKSRFTLTIRILRLLLIVVLLYGIYIIILNIATDKMNMAEENDFYTKLALEWKNPNLRGQYGYEEENITPFGTKKLSYTLIKKVGRSDTVVGEAEITKSIINHNSFIEYDLPAKGQYDGFSFSYLEDPRTARKLEANPQPGVWETLEMLHEGTVAELAFSTDRFMSPEELLEALSSYDVDVLWMPLHTGEFENFTPGYGTSGDNLLVDNMIGLTGARTVSEDFISSSSLAHRLDRTTIEDSQEVMLQHIEALLSEKPSSYYEGFLGLGHLEERYNYLKENGFIVYGAVVTGPVKELLKLQDEEMIQGEQLGEVELWNWENQ